MRKAVPSSKGSRTSHAASAPTKSANVVVRLGRRPGATDTKERILDAAELMFATHGFSAAPLRQVAASAKVNQALLFHYFGSKEGLYHAVFLRRGKHLASERLRRLDVLETRGAPSVEKLIEAYLLPAFELKRQGAGGMAFLRLQSRLHAEPDDLTRDLRASAYDESMQRYLAAFGRALPKLAAKTLYWRMVFCVGAYLYTVADLHRMSALTGGQCDPTDLDESLKQLIGFIRGGLQSREP